MTYFALLKVSLNECFISFTDVPQQVIGNLQRLVNTILQAVLKMDITAVQLKILQLLFKQQNLLYLVSFTKFWNIESNNYL